MRGSKRFLSSVLIFTVLAMSLPTTTRAAESNKDNADNSSPKVEAVKEKKEAKIIKELEERREANVKYFLKDDFSYEAVVYPEPVHYLDNGKWLDVDNTLEETKDDSVVTEETTSDDTSSDSKAMDSTGEAAIVADETEGTIGNAAKKAEKIKDSKNVLKNKQNDYNVNFAKNSKSNKLVNIQKDNYSISWSIEGAEKTKAEAIAADSTAVDNTIKAETEEKVEKSDEFKEFSTAQKPKAKETIIDN